MVFKFNKFISISLRLLSLVATMTFGSMAFAVEPDPPVSITNIFLGTDYGYTLKVTSAPEANGTAFIHGGKICVQEGKEYTFRLTVTEESNWYIGIQPTQDDGINFDYDKRNGSRDGAGPNSTYIYITKTFNTPGAHIIAKALYYQGADFAYTSMSTEYIEVYVPQVDLDIDSDNDEGYGAPDQDPTTEDAIEDDPTMPGKFVCVNDDDSDSDGIPDYADGFNWDSASGTADEQKDDTSTSDHFVQLIVELPDPLDLSVAKLKITYSDSDPASVTHSGTPAVWAPGSGKLRIWKKDANQSRNKNSAKATSSPGDFVPAGEYDDVSKLGLSGSTRTVTLYVEGIDKSAAIGDQEIKIEILPDGPGAAGSICSDVVRSTIIKVESVEWETYPGNTTLDTCLNNGGKRIYPDKQNPTDSSASVRKKVLVKAKITPAVAGQTVYFRTFDVDDPISSTDPSDDNDASGPTGGDNRGADGGLSATSSTTDSSGYATVEFTVSMQPGDNYRALANCCEPPLSALTQTQVDSGAIPLGIAQSGMLTVWRKLWVEYDSMNPIPVSKRRAIGWVDKASVGLVNDQTFEADFTFWADGVHPDENEYEGGPLKFILYNSSGGNTELTGFTAMQNENNYLLNNKIVILPALTLSQKASIAAATTVKFQMSDDDDYTIFDSPNYSDGGSVLISALKDAYIYPRNAAAFNTTPLHECIPHVTLLQYSSGLETTRDISSADDLWATHVVSCFEPSDGIADLPTDLGDDNDPDFFDGASVSIDSYNPDGSDESSTAGISRGWFNSSLIFLEVIREEAEFREFLESGITYSDIMNKVVTHEIGHTAGIGLFHVISTGKKIMHGNLSESLKHDSFCDEHIDDLRRISTW